MTTKLDHAKLWRQIGEGLSPKKSQALSLDHGQHGGRVHSRLFLKTFVVFSEHCEMSFPTPSFAHLKKTDYDNIYEPAEDTFLMMDALEKDAEFLKGQRYYSLRLLSIFDPLCILAKAGFNFCGVGVCADHGESIKVRFK